MAYSDPVRIAFIDVGQGDSTVIHKRDAQEAVIVDCCDAFAVLSYMQKNQLQRIRSLVITHVHSDHCRGVPELLNNANCEEILFLIPEEKLINRLQLLGDSDGHSELNERTRISILRELVVWVQKNRHRYKKLTKDAGPPILPMPEILELIHPWEVDVSDLLMTGLNNTSAVLKVRGAKSSALLLGDLEPRGWPWLTRHASDLQSDVLKFPHHGGWRNGNPDEILTIVAPSVVVISVGTNGSRFDHPNPHVFNAIHAHPNIRLLCTQATEKCSKVIHHTRSAVLALFEAESGDGNFFFVEQDGCPCAGTVIIELGDSVEVIQPTKRFHQDTVIHRYLLDEHKCMVGPDVLS